MLRLFFSVFDRRRRSLWPRQMVASLLTAALLLQSAPAVAPGPGWWAAQEVLDTSPSAYPDDFAAANIGQLKHMAAKAAAAMNDELPGGAGTSINDLVASWAAAAAPGVVRDDFQPLNLGQLKHVAKLFYDRLSLPYPWTGGEARQDDYLWANVGQLKNVFSFELSFRSGASSTAEIPPAVLAAAEDLWESLAVPPAGSTADDFDGDGISNLQEYLMGTPLMDPLDLDGDRISDLVEDLYPGILDKLDFSDAVADYDGDGVMNFEELLLGLDPASATTSGRTDGLTDAQVLAWGLLVPGTTLAPSTDALAAAWLLIDAAWVDAIFGDSAWLNQADADSDGEADGLTAFRNDFSWAVDSGYIEYPPSPYDLDGDSIPDMDRDSDGMPDLWEYRHSLNLRDWQDWEGDPDEDLVLNADEFIAGTNPRLADTDGDGFEDAFELDGGSDPTLATSLPPLVLSSVSSPSLSVAPQEASGPLTVQVTQGGIPYAGAEVLFEVDTATAGLLTDGLLRAGTGAAASGASVTVLTDAAGLATVSYLAGATAPGAASVRASLASNPTQEASFSLEVIHPAPSWTFGAPYGGGPFGGDPSGNNAGLDEQPELKVGANDMYAGFGRYLIPDRNGKMVATDSFNAFAGPHSLPEKRQWWSGAKDLTSTVATSFGQRSFVFKTIGEHGGQIPMAEVFQDVYTAPDDAPGAPTRYSKMDSRDAVALKVDKGPENSRLTVLAMIYRNTDPDKPWIIYDDPAYLIDTGVITVGRTSKNSGWSPNLDAYCRRDSSQPEVVIVDPGRTASRTTTRLQITIRLVPIEIKQLPLVGGLYTDGSHDGTTWVDAPMAATSNPRFGRWHNAFTEPGGAIKQDWIKDDPDRTIVRISGDLIDPAVPWVNVKVKGIKGVPGRATDDGFLQLTQKDGGWESEPFLFVADNVDDTQYNGDDNLDGDNNSHDQTRLAGFGAELSIKVQLKGQATQTEIPLGRMFQPKGTVKVELTILQGHIAVTQEDKNKAQRDFDEARLLYRQIGVDLVQQGEVQVKDLPAGYASYMSTVGSLYTNTPVDWDKPNPKGEQFGDYMKRISAGAKVAKLFFIDTDIQDVDVDGLLNVIGYSELDLFSLVESDYNSPMEGCLIAHELAHLLGATSHAPSTDTHRILVFPMPDFSPDHTAPRRFGYSEESRFRDSKFYKKNPP